MAQKSARDRIIETALDLFVKHGYHNVSVDRIAKESQISKGGFYHSFKSKDELLYTIHDIFISYALDKAREAYGKRETPTERLYEIIMSFSRVFELYKPHTTVFYQENHSLAPEYYEKIKVKRDSYTDIINKVVQEGMENGEFRSKPPFAITSMAIFGMINWTYKWYRPNGQFSIDEIGRIYADFILHALMTEQAKQNPKFSRLLLDSN